MQNAFRLAVIAGLTLFDGAGIANQFLLTYELLPRHPEALEVAMIAGFGLLLIGTVVAVRRKNRIMDAGLAGLLLGLLLGLIIPAQG